MWCPGGAKTPGYCRHYVLLSYWHVMLQQRYSHIQDCDDIYVLGEVAYVSARQYVVQKCSAHHAFTRPLSLHLPNQDDDA